MKATVRKTSGSAVFPTGGGSGVMRRSESRPSSPLLDPVERFQDAIAERALADRLRTGRDLEVPARAPVSLARLQSVWRRDPVSLTRVGGIHGRSGARNPRSARGRSGVRSRLAWPGGPAVRSRSPGVRSWSPDARSRSVWRGPAAFVGRPGTRGALAVALACTRSAGRRGTVDRVTSRAGHRAEPTGPAGSGSCPDRSRSPTPGSSRSRRTTRTSGCRSTGPAARWRPRPPPPG